MRNERNTNALDIDYRTLAPAEWEALKRHIIRRAHWERSEMIGRGFGALFAWLRHVAVRARDAVFHVPPAFPSHRV